MKTSGSILRGHLRPIGARSPPFLLIGLLVILGILGFNYWNLSYEYDAIVKEISDLQDHLRIAVLKKENTDKQSEALQKRFREAEQQLGKAKITADQNQRDLTDLEQRVETKNAEVQLVQTKLDSCQSLNSKLNSNQDVVEALKKKVEQLETEKNFLKKANGEISTERQDLRSKVEKLQRTLAMVTSLKKPRDPFMSVSAQPSAGSNTNEALPKISPEITNIPDKAGDIANTSKANETASGIHETLDSKQNEIVVQPSEIQEGNAIDGEVETYKNTTVVDQPDQNIAGNLDLTNDLSKEKGEKFDIVNQTANDKVRFKKDEAKGLQEIGDYDTNAKNNVTAFTNDDLNSIQQNSNKLKWHMHDDKGFNSTNVKDEVNDI